MVLPTLKSMRAASRIPQPGDASILLSYRVSNRDHFAPWEPQREASYYTLDHCRQTIVDASESARLDRGYPFLVFDSGEQGILASFTLSNVVRGPFQACLLGYGIGARL